MPVEINALESDRFGIVAAHVCDPHESLIAINAAAAKLGVQMLTLRLDCGDHGAIHAAEADGFRLMDTIVYHARLLGEPLAALPAGAAAIRTALPQDADAVGNIARASFSEYFGHYHADPRLDPASADAAYVDWARRSVSHQSDTAQASVLIDEGRVAGFLTTRQNSQAEHEIVLNAVHPEFRRRGHYERLLHDALARALAAGTKRMIVSTQLNNFRVQRIWSKAGFQLASARHTFHKWYV